MRHLILIATLVALTSTAAAQPGMTPISPNGYGPAPAPAQPAYLAPQPAVDHPVKSESTARLAALGVTALGISMIYMAGERESPELGWAGVATTLVGPSAGHIYAGETSRAAKMTLVRTGGLAVFVVGAISTFASADCIDYCAPADDSNGKAMMWVGGAVVVGSALYDLYDAPLAARRANARHQASWQVAPTVMSARGQTLPAVALSGSF